MAAKTRQNKTTDATPRSGKLIGYARVSTTDQDLKVQRESLRRAGVGVVFEEKGERHETRWPHRAAKGAVDSG